MKQLNLLFALTIFVTASLSLNAQTQNALDFTAADNNYVTFGDHGIGTTYTVECWINPDILVGTGDANTWGFTVFASSFQSSQGYPLWIALRNGEVRVWSYESNSNGFTTTTGAGLLVNEWAHLAVTATYGGTTKLYINGVEELSFTNGGEVSWSTIFTVGDLRPDRDISFDGKIDDIRVWNVVRTQQEIRDNMYGELKNPAGEAGLVSYYMFNEGTGQVVNDSKGSFDGELGNSPNADPRDPDWVSSTAPIPYYTIADGNWSTDATWAAGQNAPVNSWSRVSIGDWVDVTAAASCEEVTVVSGGSLIEDGNLTATTAMVERVYTGGQWHLISSPVTGAVSGMYTGLYLQSHDEVSNSYSDVIATNTPLTPGQGFALWNQNGDATATYTGILTSTATMALTRTATGYDNGWNLVGNPYSSSIDWNAAGWTKLNVNATTYCLTGATWATYNGTTGVNGGTQYIASGQGFFVEVNDAQTSGTLGFTTDVQAHDNTTFFKEEPADVVKLKVSGNNFSDETAVYFREEATTGYDGQMDAHQIPNFENLAPYIYSTANQGMAINVLPEVATVPMNVKVGSQTGTFTIETVSNGEFSELHLKDLSTGIITDLNANSYTFDYIPGVESRFELHFGPLAVNDNTVDLYNIYSYNKDVYVATSLNTNGTIMVYDMMGKEIAQAAISGTTSVITLNKSGYYVVKVLSDEGIATKKVFIK